MKEIKSGVLMQARNLRRTLNGRTLWQDLNLDLCAGESVALTGPSGSGKSLLLRALSGLDPLEAGEVVLGSKAQWDWAMPAYRSRMMYLPQRPALFEGAVLDNLGRPFALAARRGQELNRAELDLLLAKFGRDQAFLQLDTVTLSGGEGQIVALLRALLLNPGILLLDEATSALDPDTVRVAERLLLDWSREGPERALLWVSHDPAQRARVASREMSIHMSEVAP